MSSTVWIKLRNSHSGKEITLEDDYVAFTRAVPELGEVCSKHGVADLNEFVDYGEVSKEFADEVDAEIMGPEFTFKRVADLVKALTAIQSEVDKPVLRDVRAMLDSCSQHERDYDLVGLTFIM